MRIFNESKTEELNGEILDYETGYLMPDKLLIAHRDAVVGKTAEEIAKSLTAQGSVCNLRVNGNWYKQTKIYEDGGAEEEQIFPIESKEAYDEYEDIQVYVPYNAEELKKRADDKRHAELKAELAKIKEDIEQETFGLVRDDFAEKKARAAEIINELRILEGKEPREVST